MYDCRAGTYNFQDKMICMRSPVHDAPVENSCQARSTKSESNSMVMKITLPWTGTLLLIKLDPSEHGPLANFFCSSLRLLAALHPQILTGDEV